MMKAKLLALHGLNVLTEKDFPLPAHHLGGLRGLEDTRFSELWTTRRKRWLKGNLQLGQ